MSYFADRPGGSPAGYFIGRALIIAASPRPTKWPLYQFALLAFLDTCGFPKDNFWYYQASWTDKPVIHLLPHTGIGAGKEGQNINVWCYANCPQVELFLNDQSLGKKDMPANQHLSNGKFPMHPES